MKKLILITVIFLLQSFSSYAEIRSKGIICYNLDDKNKKDVIALLLNLDIKTYIRYAIKNLEDFEDLSEFGVLDEYYSYQNQSSDEYLMNEKYILTHIDKINRFNGTTENNSGKIVHSYCDLVIFKENGISYYKQFQKILLNILEDRKKKFEEKITTRKF
jgi:hypothetical protein